MLSSRLSVLLLFALSVLQPISALITDDIWGGVKDIKGFVDDIPGDLKSSFCELKKDVETKIEGIPGDVANNIVPTITNAIHNIPYINQIPSVIPSITHEIDNIPYINQIPSVVPSITDKIDSIPFISTIPSVLTQVNNIPAIGNNMEDILNVGIPGLDQKLEDVKEIIELAILNPFGAIDEALAALPPEVTELAEKLEQCIGQITDLVDPMKAVYEILLKNMPEIEIDIIPEIPEISELVYKAAAIVLLPLKPAVELTCDEVLPTAISAVSTVINGVSSRRRLNEEQKPNPHTSHCPNDPSLFCPSKKFEFAHEIADNNAYVTMAKGFGGKGQLLDKTDLVGGSNPEVYQRIRIAKFILTIFSTVTDVICSIVTSTSPKEVENVNTIQQ
eukprot:87896_1